LDIYILLSQHQRATSSASSTNKWQYDYDMVMQCILVWWLPNQDEKKRVASQLL